jgi:hypothetical protein
MIRHILPVTLLSVSLLASSSALAEPFAIKQEMKTRGLLNSQKGAVVTLQLGSGKELTGTVENVGDHLVHLSKLSGRDFYDAAVQIEDIEAVVAKARSK